MAKSQNESINISIFTALKVSEISKVPVLLMSNPGLGKSTTVQMFADIRGYEMKLLRGNSTTENEVLGYDVTDKDKNDNVIGIKHCRPSWFNDVLRNSEKGKPTLLFLDEITTANAWVQAALLHLVFERMVGDDPLPEDTLIVSAGNYAQNLNNQMDLLPPLMNRFMIVNITPDYTDLDYFLCKYEGAIASSGTRKDFFKELTNKMKELDSQEQKIPEGQLNKIGEYIERCIKETTKFLCNSGEKVIDFNVKDLQGLYSDADDDSKLCGFVTFRTLNYLRDVTLATFKCFGKAGITSNNYRNMVDGLCGYGISRSSKTKDVKKTYIGKDYYDAMINVINDIEKMKNDSLPKYEKFFKSVMDGKKKFEKGEMDAIKNKIEELMKDKSLDGIERPIDPELVVNLCKLLTASGKSVSSMRITSDEKMLDKITPETFMGYVTYLNTLFDLFETLSKVITNPSMNYKSSTVSELDKSKNDVRNCGFRLRSLRKVLLMEDPDLVEMIPEIRKLKQD